ncbi:Rieske 2Fe-2S domain-containing protein [Undibacterium arcticum]
MQDRCPHRFIPLHLGTIRGDRIECGYHGLQFDCSGSCVKKIPMAMARSLPQPRCAPIRYRTSTACYGSGWATATAAPHRSPTTA